MEWAQVFHECAADVPMLDIQISLHKRGTNSILFKPFTFWISTAKPNSHCMTNSFLLNEIKVMAWFWVTSQAQEAYLGQSHWLHNSLQWQDKNKETCHLDTLLPPWKLHLSVTSSIGTILLMKGHLVRFSLGLHQHKPWYHSVQPGSNWGIVDIFLLVRFCSCLTK